MSFITKTTKATAVVLASGGLDSCVTATLASREYQIAMLHTMYGQRTQQRELKAFNDIAQELKAWKTLTIKMDHFSAIGGSALTDSRLAVPETGIDSTAIPVTYVPFRNANLLAAAVSWAEVIGAIKVFIGVNQVDSSGYPDCRAEFIDAFNRAIELGTKPDTRIAIEAPLINLDKDGIVKLGMKLDAPFIKSWSCYQNEDHACGLCDSCRLRLKGFASAGIADPIPYQKNLQNNQ